MDKKTLSFSFNLPIVWHDVCKLYLNIFMVCKEGKLFIVLIIAFWEVVLASALPVSAKGRGISGWVGINISFMLCVCIQRCCTVQTCIWRPTLLSAASRSERTGHPSCGKTVGVRTFLSLVLPWNMCRRPRCRPVLQERDVREGADMLMVKPGLPYLDIVREVKDKVC